MLKDYVLETWKPIDGYAGDYEVSSFGRVRSLKRKNLHILKQWKNADGYHQVELCHHGATKTWSVHRLVALAFVDGYKPDLVVCHNDSNPSNNHVENLRWDTLSSNSFDRVDVGNHFNAEKTHCVYGHRLINPNLVPAKLKIGRRCCLACSRARSILRTTKNTNFVTLANNYYVALGMSLTS